MMVDEFYFHHLRGLGKWESKGHPIDTLCFLVCFFIASFFEYSHSNLWAFILCAALSCIIIVKDEFIHTQECSPKENIIHAFLFQIHPLSLIGLFWMWKNAHIQYINIQILVITVFLTYQIYYWNFYRKEKYETKN